MAIESINHVLISGALTSPKRQPTGEGQPECVTCALRCPETRQGITYYTYVPCLAYGRVADILAPLHEHTEVLLLGALRWRKQQGDKPGRVELYVRSATVLHEPQAPVKGET